MRNVTAWRPTRFDRTTTRFWRANPDVVPVSSRLIIDRMAEAYAGAIEQHANGRLADLGCGEVPLYGMYSERVSEVLCVDWPESLHGSKFVDIFADLNAPLDLDPDSFDTVIATDVIEHLYRPRFLIDSAAAMLRAGGTLILGAPFLYWIHEAPHDYHRYTSFALAKMIKDAKLDLVSLKPVGGAPEVLVDIATKMLASRPRLARVAHWIGEKMLAWRPVRKLSTVTAESMPIGYVVIAQKPY